MQIKIKIFFFSVIYFFYIPLLKATNVYALKQITVWAKSTESNAKSLILDYIRINYFYGR